MVEDKDGRGAAVRAAYQKATAALRAAHAEEFRGLLEAEYKAAGVTVRQRLTAEERAEKQAQEAAEKAAVKAAKAAAKQAAEEAKRAARVERLKAQLAALEPDEPSF